MSTPEYHRRAHRLTRAPRRDVVEERAAQTIVKDTVILLASWHRTLARLRGQAVYGHLKTSISSSSEELTTLFEVVTTRRALYADVVSRLDPRIASHARVTDTSRALDRLAVIIEAAQPR